MIDFFLWKKTNDLSTIVWVSIHVWPKFPSRVHHLLQKVIILNCDGLWTLALVWRVERPNSRLLAVWLVEIDGLSTFGYSVKPPWVRATSHTRLRTRDHYTSSTLIGGKAGAGPSLLHNMPEGLTEYVNARWMWSLHGFLHGIIWVMFHGHLDYFEKPPLGGRPNTKPGDHGTPKTHNRWIILFYHVCGPT
jgi:hypothetical protein